MLSFKPSAVTLHSTHVTNTYTAPRSQSAKSSVFSTQLVITSITESRTSYQIRPTSAVKDSAMTSSVIQHISTTEVREKPTTAMPTTEEHETGSYIF